MITEQDPDDKGYRGFFDVRYDVDKILAENARLQAELDARPIPHGARGDARYPSPRTLRRMLAFAVDWSLHAAVLVLLFVTVPLGGGAVGLVTPFAGHLLVSFANRVVLQSVTQTTVGKALFDLRIIRSDNGQAADFAYLARTWLRGIPAATESVWKRGSSGFDFPNEVRGTHPEFPCAVRTRDLKARSPEPERA
ncbi:RDD family protein [Rhodococcus rhodnii]|uniref:RDD domain-containing protein n=2 Tax=Rhodococcus rhodnii TaxID=38312 RepID=R7WL04_9NOCA|nr:RDD family protein [Rhodococcus rhodnii]EOM75965.1 hypothetical protein Rrhod_2719 [Rhodococcus rhodnii LMG 5362]TXG90124.1 RDD family protein [Rhodococcus rhodnii]